MINRMVAPHFATALAIASAELAAVRQQIADTEMEIALGKLVLDSMLDRFGAAGACAAAGGDASA